VRPFDSAFYTIAVIQPGTPPWLDEIDNEVDITLTTDIGGLPGIVMETWHLSGALLPATGLNPPTTVTSAAEPRSARVTLA